MDGPFQRKKKKIFFLHGALRRRSSPALSVCALSSCSCLSDSASCVPRFTCRPYGACPSCLLLVGSRVRVFTTPVPREAADCPVDPASAELLLSSDLLRVAGWSVLR